MSTTTDENAYLSAEAAAKFVDHAPGTLRNMASAGVGPRSYKVGRGRRLYKRADLIAWVESGGAAGAAA